MSSFWEFQFCGELKENDAAIVDESYSKELKLIRQ